MTLLAYGLAVWRLSHMLVYEAGPNRAFANLRERTGIESIDGKPISWPDWNPLHCVMCTSIYAAVLLAFVPTRARDVLAASAVAVLVQEVVTA